MLIFTAKFLSGKCGNVAKVTEVVYLFQHDHF